MLWSALRSKEKQTEVDGLKKYRVGARSAAGSMTALSLAPNVREHGFQMHHYRGCAGDPLKSLRCEAAFFCLLFFAAGKEK